jgi:pyruvate/2-oxoacid:ferredoxin oxidoreductase alpha subunit
MEGISYACGSELPIVIADIMRGGPGLGNIGPEQSDYNQMLHGGGHGQYKLLTLAPNSAQEMCDFTMLAFDLADKYRNPAVILTDGFIGQMMEPVDFPKPVMHDHKRTRHHGAFRELPKQSKTSLTPSTLISTSLKNIMQGFWQSMKK